MVPTERCRDHFHFAMAPIPYRDMVMAAHPRIIFATMRPLLTNI